MAHPTSEDTGDTVRSPRHSWRRPHVATTAALVAIVGLGLWNRLPGFSRYDLWFDDAWAALPAKVPLGVANKMVATTPAYSLAMREWLHLHPGSTIWAQVPSFVFSMVGIVAIYAVVRFFTFSRTLGLVASLVIAAGPVTSLYATRMKEYAADFLIACVVLWLAERWRREPSWRSTVAVTLTGGLGLLVSAQTLLVTGPVLAMMALVCVRERTRIRYVLAAASGVGLAVLVGEAVWFRHLVPQLSTNWTTKGYMLNLSTLHSAYFSVTHMLSGLGHGFIGLVIPYSFYLEATSWLAVLWATLVGLVLTGLIVLVAVDTARSWRHGPGPLVAPALTVIAAVAGAATQMTPLGGGRTDEVLYPALILLLCGGCAWVQPRLGAHRAVLISSATAAALALASFGFLHTARYPEVDLKGIMEALPSNLLPGDRIVIDGYASFTWANDDISPWRVNFAQGQIPWPMGFHVSSTRDDIIMSGEYLQPDGHVDAALHTGHRLWYVGITIGASNPSAPKGLLNFPLPTPTHAALLAAGWQPTVVHVTTTHAEASLFTHQ